MTKSIAFLASLFLASVSFLGGALPASAHADLVGTDPVDGAVLEAAPKLLTLTFGEQLLEGTVEIAVTNSAGELVTGIVPESAQTTATALWPAGLPAGEYKVAYRVVSEDGHPVTGTFSFSYLDSASASATETASASASAEPEVTAMESSSAQPIPAAPASNDSAADSGSLVVWVLGFLAVALVVAGYFIWRKRST